MAYPGGQGYGYQPQPHGAVRPGYPAAQPGGYVPQGAFPGGYPAQGRPGPGGMPGYPQPGQPGYPVQPGYPAGGAPVGTQQHQPHQPAGGQVPGGYSLNAPGRLNLRGPGQAQQHNTVSPIHSDTNRGSHADSVPAPIRAPGKTPTNSGAPGGGAGAGAPAENLDDAREAALEHANTASCCGSLEAVKHDYGRGIWMYFKYIQYLTGLNAVMAVPALVTFVAAAPNLDTQSYSGLSLLFIDAYPTSVRPLWIAMTVLLAVFGFGLGPGYNKFQQKLTAAWRGENRMEEIAYNDDDIIENRAVTAAQRRRRQHISIGVFVLVLVLQGVLTYYLQLALSAANSQVTGLILAVLFRGLNLLWKQLSKWMTVFERHRTKRSYTEWDTFKVFTLKLANVLVLYVTKEIIRVQKLHDDSDVSRQVRCGVDAQAYQFFYFILMDITIGNLSEIVMPFLNMMRRKAKSKDSGTGSEADKQVFDLAEEFTEVLYRQFVVLLGAQVFPLITIMAVVSFALEFWLDKMRLIYICRKSLIKPDPVRPKLMLYCHVVIALAAILSWPNGMAFIFARLGRDSSCNFFK